MELSEKFTLKWNDFVENVAESFANLRNEEDFFDVTLVSEDLQQLTAHKVVLSSCSPVLKYLLKSSSHPHPVLFLKGARFRDLEYIVDFIYSGQVDIPQEHLNDFLQLAQDLKLKGISTENRDLKREQNDRNIFVSEDEDI